MVYFKQQSVIVECIIDNLLKKVELDRAFLKCDVDYAGPFLY